MHSARTGDERFCIGKGGFLRIPLLALALILAGAPAVRAQVAEVQVTPNRLTLEPGKRRTL